MTETVPISIPTTVLTPLLDAAATAPLLDEPYRAVLLATDNYPFYGVELNTSSQRITYRALSQLPIPLPWRVLISGDSTIYVSYTPTIGPRPVPAARCTTNHGALVSPMARRRTTMIAPEVLAQGATPSILAGHHSFEQEFVSCTSISYATVKVMSI